MQLLRVTFPWRQRARNATKAALYCWPLAAVCGFALAAAIEVFSDSLEHPLGFLALAGVVYALSLAGVINGAIAPVTFFLYDPRTIVRAVRRFFGLKPM